MKRKFIVSLMMACLLIVGTGCAKQPEEDKKKDDPVTDVTKNDKEESKEAQEIYPDRIKDGKVELTLYIGYDNKDGEYYHKVKVMSSEYNPQTFNLGDQLVAALAEETSWNLTLADPVHDLKGDGGRRISFTDESCFVVGPPQPQKEDYTAYDIVSFTQLVLDSIQKTFDENFKNKDNSSMKLYFSVFDDEIEVENKKIPTDVPWNELQDNVLKTNE